MPAETHSQGEPVDVAEVLGLIWMMSAGADQPPEPDPSTPLAVLGLQDEHSRLWIWETAVEEYAERTLAEPVTDVWQEATTVGELADAITRSVQGESTRSAGARSGAPEA